MNVLISRLAVLSMILALLFVPLYAHHGMQFLSKAVEMNTAEVRIAELAANKSENQRVKDFAQMVMRDHKQAIDKIRGLQDARTANTKSAARQGEGQLAVEHQRTLDKLSGLSGAGFDREFMSVMVMNHQNAIRLFEAQSRVHGNARISKKDTATATAQNTIREKPGEKDDRKYSSAELSRDADAAEFAKEALPTIRHHYEQAQMIQRALSGTSSPNTKKR
jgi:predicted outer membrane protein